MPDVDPLCDSLVDDIHSQLNSDIDGFARKYELPISSTKWSPGSLSSALSASRKLRVLITIDEFDRVARRLAKHDGNKAASARDALRNILGAIKDNCGHCSLFMTGVTPVTIREIASPANFITDVSFYPCLATACGLPPADVKAEIARIVSQRPELEGDPCAAEDLFQFMQDYFNGYRFVQTEQTTIYNPQQCLSFFHFLAEPLTPIGNVLETIRAARRDGTYLLRTETAVTAGIDINSQVHGKRRR
jgi:hypothetical protein